MKLLVFIPPLALGVFAEPIPELDLSGRDIAAVNSAFNRVDVGLKNLDSAVQAFTKDPTQLNQATDDLLGTITSVTTEIQAGSDLTLQDATSLQASVMGLVTSGTAVVNDFEAKKPAIAAASLCGTVLDQTTSISTASQLLVAAVIAKLPAEARQIGMQVAAGVTEVLQRPALAFAPSNCTAGVGTSGTVLTATIQSTRTVASFNPASATAFGNATAATGPTRSRVVPSNTGSATPFQADAAPAPTGMSGPVGLVAVALAALML